MAKRRGAIALGTAVAVAAVVIVYGATKLDDNPVPQAGTDPGYRPPASSSAPPTPTYTVTADLTKSIPDGFNTYDTGGKPLHVTAGGLTQDGPTTAPAGGYLQTHLAKPVRVMRAVVVFSGGRRSGSFGFESWVSPVVASYRAGRGAPSARMHVSVSPTDVVIGVFDSKTASVRQVSAMVWPSALRADGHTRYRVTLTRSGDEVTVDVAGEPLVTGTDPQFAHVTRWVSWELYENTTRTVPATLVSVAAG